MIDVSAALRDLPHFDSFCSVKKLHDLVAQLREDARFTVETAGTSVNGIPIHHVRFGTGSVKALIVAGPHAPEPIGSLTIFSLMTLLQQDNPALTAADVEWHLVPCIDPDGTLLNEGWSQQPFTLASYMRNYHLQAPSDQVDISFPLAYKKLQLNQPSKEARILQDLLDRIRPDFFFSLHNAWTGGAFYFLSHDIDHKYHREIYELLEQHRFPVQTRPIWRELCAEYGPGIVQMFTIKKYYDYLEQTTPGAQDTFTFGAGSWDYLAEIKPEALTFVAETGYVRHPSDESERDTGRNLRQFKLQLDANSKYLGTVILEEWNKVKADVDVSSPFYRALAKGMVFPDRDKLAEGGTPLSRFPTREILFSPEYARTMTEGDLFNACMVDGGFLFLPVSYQFVRLLKASPQTAAVRQAIARLDQAFDEALASIARHIDFDAFEAIDCDTLAAVQLGSGFIVLNSLLEAHA